MPAQAQIPQLPYFVYISTVVVSVIFPVFLLLVIFLGCYARSQLKQAFRGDDSRIVISWINGID
jgi:hypothetical protein